MRRLLLALAVVSVWESNFVVIKVALGHLPPPLFAALRFTFALVPAVLFLPRPSVRWPNLGLCGTLIGVGQFGLLYIAMDGRISAGIASLVIQMQVFFTIGLWIWLGSERMRAFLWLARLLATAGIAVIVHNTDGTTTVAGLLLVLVGALSWAGGNSAALQGKSTNMLASVVWSSAFAMPPLVALSLLVEGWDAALAGLRQADLATWAAVAWQGWGNTLFGYAAWGWLLVRHPAATVMPMALLVPVFGMGAAALVMSGLAVNLLWPRLRTALAR